MSLYLKSTEYKEISLPRIALMQRPGQHTSDTHCAHENTKLNTGLSSASPRPMPQPGCTPTALHPPLASTSLSPPFHATGARAPNSRMMKRRRNSCGAHGDFCGGHHSQRVGGGKAQKNRASGHLGALWSLRHIDGQRIGFERGTREGRRAKMCDDWKRKRRLPPTRPRGRLWGFETHEGSLPPGHGRP